MGKGRILIKNGRLFVPGRKDELSDVLIEDGRVLRTGNSIPIEGAKVLYADGCIVVPGLIDIHVHLREPGFEWKETIASGTRAAAAGGFTRVCCMPNTSPPNDSAQVTSYIIDKSSEVNLARVLPIGAISKGLKGKEMAPIEEMVSSGAVAFSDDGYPVCNAQLMRRALEYASMYDVVLTVHEETKALSEGFSMNESPLALEMGLVGMPGASEEVMISRDIELARLTKSRVHFCHVSTSRGALLIERAKNDGISVTAEVSPHHLTLTEEEVRGFNTSAKMSMPLRGIEDVEGLQNALQRGVIDCVASDHAPHEKDSKDVEFDKASFGILGLQTTLPVVLGLVREKKLTLDRAIESLTSAAAECLKLPMTKLDEGSVADVTVIDPNLKITLTEDKIFSKSKNTPWQNKELMGNALYTIAEGELIWEHPGGRKGND